MKELDQIAKEQGSVANPEVPQVEMNEENKDSKGNDSDDNIKYANTPV